MTTGGTWLEGKSFSSNPSSSNYAEQMINKAHNKSPYGEAEPSTKTTYK